MIYIEAHIPVSNVAYTCMCVSEYLITKLSNLSYFTVELSKQLERKAYLFKCNEYVYGLWYIVLKQDLCDFSRLLENNWLDIL